MEKMSFESQIKKSLSYIKPVFHYYIFKEHVKIAKICTVKFNITIFNRLKTMGVL